MASHRSPYGDLIVTGSTTAAAAAATAAAVHLPDYINPMDSEFHPMRERIYMYEGVKRELGVNHMQVMSNRMRLK